MHSFLSREREEGKACSHRLGCVTVFTSYFILFFIFNKKTTFLPEMSALIAVHIVHGPPALGRMAHSTVLVESV